MMVLLLLVPGSFAPWPLAPAMILQKHQAGSVLQPCMATSTLTCLAPCMEKSQRPGLTCTADSAVHNAGSASPNELASTPLAALPPEQLHTLATFEVMLALLCPPLPRSTRQVRLPFATCLLPFAICGDKCSLVPLPV